MKYNGNLAINFDQIHSILQKGIIGKVKPGSKGPFDFAHEGGRYLGAPGKELYFALPELSEQQMEKIAALMASHYPSMPPNNHVKWAACIRYVYGCFEKQGCLRSLKDKQRMISEDPDWTLPNKFMQNLRSCFQAKRCRYGLVLWYEMSAHRLGDRAIIDSARKEEYLTEMIDCYEKAQELGVKIKSWKHTFTPYFWAASYFFENGDKSRAIQYHKKTLNRMNKYCPDARDGYREKARTSLGQLRECLGSDYGRWLAGFKKKMKNKCLKKVIK